MPDSCCLWASSEVWKRQCTTENKHEPFSNQHDPSYVLTGQTNSSSIILCDEILLHVFLSSYQSQLHGERWTRWKGYTVGRADFYFSLSKTPILAVFYSQKINHSTSKSLQRFLLCDWFNWYTPSQETWCLKWKLLEVLFTSPTLHTCVRLKIDWSAGSGKWSKLIFKKN